MTTHHHRAPASSFGLQSPGDRPLSLLHGMRGERHGTPARPPCRGVRGWSPSHDGSSSADPHATFGSGARLCRPQLAEEVRSYCCLRMYPEQRRHHIRRRLIPGRPVQRQLAIEVLYCKVHPRRRTSSVQVHGSTPRPVRKRRAPRAYRRAAREGAPRGRELCDPPGKGGAPS